MIISGDTIQPSNGSNITVPNGTGINVSNKEIIELNSNGMLNQTPGSIIESLWSVCDGSTHVLNSGTYTVGNVTAVQTLSNTHTDITGSTITYTPPSQATKVVYRFTYSNYWVTAGHGITHHKFIIDGVDVTFSRHNRSTNQYQEHRYTFEWVINIGVASNTSTGSQISWNSPKTLKMQARNYSTGANDGALHGTVYWDGSSNNVFNIPIINIIAIR